MSIYLCAEGQVIAEVLYIVLQQEDEALEEGIILTLHVCVVDRLAEDVLVERSREITLQQLVVIHSLQNMDKQLYTQATAEQRLSSV